MLEAAPEYTALLAVALRTFCTEARPPRKMKSEKKAKPSEAQVMIRVSMIGAERGGVAARWATLGKGLQSIEVRSWLEVTSSVMRESRGRCPLGWQLREGVAEHVQHSLAAKAQR